MMFECNFTLFDALSQFFVLLLFSGCRDFGKEGARGFGAALGVLIIGGNRFFESTTKRLFFLDILFGIVASRLLLGGFW